MDNKLIKLTLKAARVNRNLTQEQAAMKLGITEKTLFNYEQGLTFPNNEIIKKMLRLYELNYENIIFPKKNKKGELNGIKD